MESDLPHSWLPPLVTFDWNDFEASVERAYAVFMRDFGTERVRPTFCGKRMGLKRHPELEGKSATFWHFITEGNNESCRTPVRERVERISWPKALLVESSRPTPRVFTWANERRRSDHGKSTRWLVALQDFSYVVVVDEREEFVLPWTAYPVLEEHRREKLRREQRAWKASRKG